MYITLCSTDIVWEDKESNFKQIEDLLTKIAPLEQPLSPLYYYKYVSSP